MTGPRMQSQGNRIGHMGRKIQKFQNKSSVKGAKVSRTVGAARNQKSKRREKVTMQKSEFQILDDEVTEKRLIHCYKELSPNFRASIILNLRTGSLFDGNERFAVYLGDVKLMEKYFMHGLNPNDMGLIGRNNEPVFNIAVMGLDVEMVNLFLKHGADPSERNYSGMDSISSLCACVGMLTRLAEEIEYKSGHPDGWNPVHVSGHHSIDYWKKHEKEICKIGAKLFVHRRFRQLIDILLTSGCRLDTTDHMGNICLHHLNSFSDPYFFRYLEHLGADRATRNKARENPISMLMNGYAWRLAPLPPVIGYLLHQPTLKELMIEKIELFEGEIPPGV